MKRILLTGALAIVSYCSYAQSFFTTSAYANLPQGVGANSIFGWGENFDRTIDVRPNPHPVYGTMMINYHTGLTFSAHSVYGGIRFYNQGYPNPYDPATGSVMVMSIVNGNVGIGTTNPNGKLDVNGAILLAGSANNTISRPVVGSTRIAGEIAGYSGSGLAADDGFLRLSAGGGTNAYIKSFIDLSGYSTIPDMAENITLGTFGTERMRITSAGNVLIGQTSQVNTSYKLDVAGNVRANELVINTNGADFVFNPQYKLPKLSDLKSYIDKEHHLPEIASADEMTKNGVALGELNTKLLQKVEELTLYLIDKDKQLEKQQREITQQQHRSNAQQKINVQLQKQIIALKSELSVKKLAK